MGWRRRRLAGDVRGREALAEFEVPFEVGVISAHRTPARMLDYARGAAGRACRSSSPGPAGGPCPAWSLSATVLPVIGVPVPLARLDGLDSLLSIVQMPAGCRWPPCPSAARETPACWPCGCWAAPDPALRNKMAAFQADLSDLVLTKDQALRDKLLGSQQAGADLPRPFYSQLANILCGKITPVRLMVDLSALRGPEAGHLRAFALGWPGLLLNRNTLRLWAFPYPGSPSVHLNAHVKMRGAGSLNRIPLVATEKTFARSVARRTNW